MIRTSIFDTPTTPRLFTFLEWVRDGQLFIPDFQRPFVWDDQRRLNLLDSVSRGLPIGAFLVWRTLDKGLRTYDSLGPFALPTPHTGDAQTFLIDGHQRLTTLYAALLPFGPGDQERLQQERRKWPVFFDLKADDADLAFVLTPRRRNFSPPPTWLPTNELFDRKALWRRQRALVEAGFESLAERTEDLANAFKDYIVPVMPLVTDDLRAVTDTFVRVNSGGRAMAEDKLLRALVYSDYRIDEHIDEVRADLDEIGWGRIDAQVFINALKIRLGMDVYRATPTDIEKAMKKRGTSEASFRESIDQLGAGMKSAAKVFRACGFPGPAILPYQYQLIGLSEALLRRSDADPEQLEALTNEPQLIERVRQWLWGTTYAGYFTGMNGSQIRTAIDQLADLISDENDSLPDLTRYEIDRLNTFRAGANRSTALVLLMAQKIPDTELRDQVWARLGENGHNAVECMFPSFNGAHPGNRVVTVPEQLRALREALRSPLLTPDADLLRNHFIPTEAVEALAGAPHDPAQFCELRADYLASLEESFVASIGLRFGS